MADRRSTRQRIVEAGMDLFAAQGYGATSVAEIEEAVGLQPRRGGLYKHFENKLAVLEAAVQSHLDSAASLATEIGSVDESVVAADVAGLASLIAALGRAFLDEMDRLELLTRVLEHDAARLPELTAEVKARIVDLSYQTASKMISAFVPGMSDPEATALLILGPLVALRRTTWTFGEAPLGIDDERCLKAWSEAAVAVLGAAVGQGADPHRRHMPKSTANKAARSGRQTRATQAG